MALRDLLEALVGRIEDRDPIDDSLTESEPPARGATAFDGLMRIEEFEEAAGVRLDDDERQGVETIGGLIASILGRFPEVGEEVMIGQRRVRVEARDGFRVARVRLLPAGDRPA